MASSAPEKNISDGGSPIKSNPFKNNMTTIIDQNDPGH